MQPNLLILNVICGFIHPQSEFQAWDKHGPIAKISKRLLKIIQRNSWGTVGTIWGKNNAKTKTQRNPPSTVRC
jgi:hypothetical protein